ncbi:MAG: hypothetical protein HFG76_02150 [Hungatella sp.]|jgi:hypothetical protein|nr:hypothetical protein [Hungatella sp.]MCI9637982.1 hypothetical protein [Hungatella sp.]
MRLNTLFTEEPIDFESRCRTRIKVGLGIAVLGLLSLAVMALGGQDTAFYGSLGAGLMAGGILSVRRNRRYLKDPALRKRQEVAENDERNRLLGLRCWAYSGYTMFLLLYVGILVSGFVDRTAAMVLLTVTGVYALVLLVFRIFLQKVM